VTIADSLVKSQKIHKRKEADFYPTPPDVTRGLMEFLHLTPGQMVWEPACGDGAMATVLAEYGHNVAATDLREDSGFGYGGVDFLTATADMHYGLTDWIITNPPFALAAEFIDKARAFTPNVAMLLNSKFWHAAGRLALFERHRPSHVLALTWRPAFLEAERGKSPMMDVIWCVWNQCAANNTEFVPIRRPARNRLHMEKAEYQKIVLTHPKGDDLATAELDADPLSELLG